MSTSTAARRIPELVTSDAEGWPPQPGSRIVLLEQSSTRLEHELIAALASRLRDAGVDAALAADGATAVGAASGDDTTRVAPVRVMWMPAGRAGDLRHGVRDLAIAAGPAELRARRQRRVLAQSPSRCRIVVGAPATLGELQARWAERRSPGARDAGRTPFGQFVDRQADIVLERAARRLTGDRYRTPRRVAEELASNPDFVDGAESLARGLGRDPAGVLTDARAYLEELATEQRPLARDLWVQWSRFMYSRAHELNVDAGAIARVRDIAAAHPVVFLPSHRSNLDAYVMTALLHEHGFPPNHTLGGINMAFWPLGPVGRRVGVIFIRRSFRENEIYKYVLRRYLGFLVSKRFNLEWYLEGGRSRTGKLLPPRLGLLNYLADAVEEQGVPDVHLVPVSIVYDELLEVHEMTSESHGAVKQPEGLPWLLRFARSQRGSFGAVHVSFGEPLVLAEALRQFRSSDGGADDRTRRLTRSKVAFEVCTRINRVTPVTATSLVTLALLGAGDIALTLDEVLVALEPLLAYVRARGIPGRRALETLRSPDGVRRTLRTLDDHGVVESFAGGAEPVHRIGPDQELVAAFYRNAAIHWFVTRAIVELALSRDASVDAVVDEALRIRDLLKFEFFFPEKDEFRDEVIAELGMLRSDELARSDAVLAPRVLRSFLEAYRVAADHLAACGGAAVDVDAAVAACLRRGRQYRLQRRVISSEAVSTHLFRSAFKLAENRGLLEEGPGLAARRAELAAELADVLRRLERIDRSTR
ncbi:MAG: glycerol-3-phosphate 1-O-acyltransferase [Solirubrobacterales bacterium]|nr:glycerol-3-phosphate 1-O-acyltransferase [Solirubrobacterales bacterium]